MNLASRLSARSSVSLGLACLAPCWGCADSSSDGGNAVSGGSGSAQAGAAGGETSGDGTSTGVSGGAAGAGPTSFGGTSFGGTGGKAAAGGAGGRLGGAGSAGACDIVECFVADTCVDECGGRIVYTGCCACAPPALNESTCGGSGNP